MINGCTSLVPNDLSITRYTAPCITLLQKVRIIVAQIANLQKPKVIVANI